MGKFDNKVALITGAASGIGKATAGRFAAEGAQVCMLDLELDAIKAAAADLKLTPGSYLAVAADITDEGAVQDAIGRCMETFGGIHILCNIAGMGGSGFSVTEYTVEQFRRVLDVNVIGSFIMIRNVMPIMQSQGFGVILNTSSGDATAAYAYEIGYSASKAAVKQMTRNIANEVGEGGRIRCCSVSPGWVLTPMSARALSNLAGQDFDNEDEMGDFGPIGRMLQPEEIADVFCFLASDEAAAINGIDVIVDGGKTLGKS